MFIASFSLLALHIWPFQQIGSSAPLYFLFAIGFIIGALVPVADEPKRNLLLLYDLIPPAIIATVPFNTTTEAYNFGLYHYLWWAFYPYRNLLNPNTMTRFPIRYTVTTAVALALFSTLPSYAPFLYQHFSKYSGQYANGHILLTMLLSEANPRFMNDFFTIGQMKPRQS